jgi:hypothetical protein
MLAVSGDRVRRHLWTTAAEDQAQRWLLGCELHRQQDVELVAASRAWHAQAADGCVWHSPLTATAASRRSATKQGRSIVSVLVGKRMKEG